MNKSIDIKNLKVAKRYAKALAEVSMDCIDEVNSSLTLVKEVIFDNPDFTTFFLHPVVSLKDKKDTLSETLKDKINTTAFNFIETLLDENRLNIFRTIFEVFQKEVDLIKNKQRVEIISAVEIESDIKEELERKLSEKLSKEVIMSYEMDENILAGFIVKVEDNVVDLSLKTKFDNLRKNI